MISTNSQSNNDVFDKLKKYIDIEPNLKFPGKKGIFELDVKLIVKHPILKGAIDIGNRSQDIKRYLNKKKLLDIKKYLSAISSEELEYLKRFSEEFKNEKKKKKKIPENIQEILERIRDKFITEIKKIKSEIINMLIERLQAVWVRDLNEKRTLIAIDFCGITFGEWPNAFYGPNDRVGGITELSSGLSVILDSIPISNNMSIWFDSLQLMGWMKREFGEVIFKEKSIKNEILNLRNISDSYCYIILISLLIYLAREKKKFREVLPLLRKSNFGYIFVNVKKGDRRCYLIPKLTPFVEQWLIKDSNRESLEKFLQDSIELINRIATSEDKTMKEYLLKRLNDLFYLLLERNYINYRIIRELVNYATEQSIQRSYSNLSFYNLSSILEVPR